ncbi:MULTISPECIES: peptidoglycan-associated lipoprotein Pal [Thalassolituus]|jgi:peptidoglycan-associated lipoprotein|uniref:Peptidoglycan-associated lipoprotein n=1 Tax=Thalassolituus maritimus TaxID=484498 RepID=A0A1N7N4X0_9GAMM|nr:MULTISPECIES: peptidoglycan-associated lipoprotein Pal [Thalassolituus]KZY95543.1 peptidoglycan-associated lipoprotein [Oleibacter sp. HI0075]MAX87355.1 peptidoglycan-associated lipoprotein [Oceanospirillaceae bacterium]MEE3160090.1 peptidoglycan-associated lipoprotein Pal [Pseudomonadota bacterium]HCG78481.1 peptidoglycan-associated lipoprotein Pal [Oceanospirillales bacterium]KZZ12900.1 peptidoglycan-associated lipoprotein [Oleibacter sp. HI0075]|tara:strand:+ start:1401 stop:1964 length:564 start_codon:yes stop_codon:yes gene_type:complete
MQKTALYKALGIAFGALLVTACANNGDLEEGAGAATTATEQQANEAADSATTGVESASLQGEQMMSDAEKAAQQALLDITVFYFDFDQSSIKESGKAALSAHAAYLASNSSARIVLEGHADERGTPEYNLALGERRAIAVRQFLMAKGASSSQIKVVSFGEEKPAVTGSTSSAYAKNRRVEVKYQSR